MSRGREPALIACWAAAAAAAAAPAFATNGAAPIAPGAKSAGRAGAETAVADDATSMFLNPAALGEIPGGRADLGGFWLIGRYRYADERNDELVEGFDTLAPVIGVSIDPAALSGGASDWRLGLGLFVPVGGGGGFDLKTAVFPDGEREETNLAAVAIAPTVAWRVTDRLSVGASFNISYVMIDSEGLVGTTGDSSGLVFRYRDSAGNPLAEPEPVIIEEEQVTYGELFAETGTEEAEQSTRVEVRDATGVGFGGTVGVLLHATDDLAFGLSYRTETLVPKVRGKARIDATRAIAAINEDPDFGAFGSAVFEAYLPDGGQRGFESDYDFALEDFRLPAVLSFGTAWRPHDRVLLALDLRYIFWKHAFDENPVTLEGGSNRDINAIQGGEDAEQRNVMRWRDQLVIATGASFLATDWLVLRAGYNYGRNPIPGETLSATTGITEHHVALGAGVWWDRFDFDIAWIYALPAEERIDESATNPALDGGAVKAEQHFIYFGASVTF